MTKMTIQRCVSLRVRKSKSEKYESLKYALELLANFGQGGEEDKPDRGRQERRREKKQKRRREEVKAVRGSTPHLPINVDGFKI